MHLRVIDKAKGRRRLKTRIEWRHDKSFDHDKWYVEDCIRSSINPPSTDWTSRKGLEIPFRLNLRYKPLTILSKIKVKDISKYIVRVLQGLNKLIISNGGHDRIEHLPQYFVRYQSSETRKYKSYLLTIHEDINRQPFETREKKIY